MAYLLLMEDRAGPAETDGVNPADGGAYLLRDIPDVPDGFVLFETDLDTGTGEVTMLSRPIPADMIRRVPADFAPGM